MEDGAGVGRLDPERGVDAAGGSAADQQRHGHAGALHLGGDRDHLVERRGDEAGQADDVGVVLVGRLQDRRPRHHDAQVDDLEIVALEDDADDVLADVVDVALDRRHDDPALRLRAFGLLRLDEGKQVGDRLLHDARRLHHLRQEHLTGAEQVADDVHAVHQRPLDDLDRAGGGEPRLLGILDHMGVEALDEGVLQPLGDGQQPPFLGRLLRHRAVALEAVGDRQQPVGGVGPAVEHDVLARLAQLGVDGVVDVELAGVDDAHVHASRDGVVEKDRVHGAAHRLVAAEREAQVRQAARDVRVRAAAADLPARLDKVDAVVVVLLDPGRDGEDVGVEDDVLGREAVAGQQLVGALADLDLALAGVGLADLVEGHDDDGGAVAADLGGVLEELGLALLHADRIDDRLAGDALQPRLDDAPLRAVDHNGHARDVGLGGDQLEEGGHGVVRVEQPLVHVDVEHLRAVLDLLARHVDGGGIVAGHHQLLEAGRAGDVCALADVDEVGAASGGRHSASRALSRYRSS